MPADALLGGEAGPIRVVVVDSDERLRRQARSALQEAGCIVIAEAGNGRDAIDLALYFRPEVVVLDVVMGNVDGLAATRAIATRAPDVRVLLHTSSDDVTLGMAGLRAGASGHLIKEGRSDSLVAAVLEVAAGRPVVAPPLTQRLIDLARALPEGGLGVRPVRSTLTTREWEVLDLLCAGMSVDGIADVLVLARDTVRTHIKRILQKLGVHSQREAIELTNRLRSSFMADGPL